MHSDLEPLEHSTFFSKDKINASQNETVYEIIDKFEEKYIKKIVIYNYKLWLK